MSKRKRELEHEPEAYRRKPDPNDFRARKYNIESVLERTKQHVFQALKLARGLERQKLGRRQKTAKAARDDADSTRLAAEVAALKSFDLCDTAEKHLYKSMLKYKAIASAPAFPTWIQSRVNEISKQAYDVAHANVQARLFNSQPVKKAMDGCMSDIRTSLGLGDAPTRRAKRTHKADYEQALDGNYVGLLPHVVKGSIPMSDGDTEAKTSSAIYRRLQDREQASSSDGNLDYGVYGSRLAASLEDSFEGFSEPEIPGAQELRAKSCNLPSKHVPRSPSIHSSVYTDRPGSLPLGNMQSPPKVNANVKATTFLPSLTMGGYWSGSEPASDDEDSLSGPRRKNRRGQRERRSIAEKKYKQNANHLRNQRKGHDMNLGWEARRGAQVDDGRGERGRVRGGKSGTLQAPSFVNGAASSSGPNSDPLRPRSAGKGKPAEGLIHPSWQAAKVAKEQNKAATFQGKRVVFD